MFLDVTGDDPADDTARRNDVDGDFSAPGLAPLPPNSGGRIVGGFEEGEFR
jgi:hypothetical protein